MSLEDKLKKLAAKKAAEQEVDWNRVRDAWIRAVRQLFTDIEGWMKPFAEKQLVTTTRVSIDLTEENIGRYKCDALELNFSGQIIRLEPQGTLIIGALGRIDIVRKTFRRPENETMLLLGGSREEPIWQLWPSRDREDARRFDQNAFEALIELWTDP